MHVLRAFEDPAVPHPAGSVDPARDAQAMEDELILADLDSVKKRRERLAKISSGRTALKGNDDAAGHEKKGRALILLEKNHEGIEELRQATVALGVHLVRRDRLRGAHPVSGLGERCVECGGEGGAQCGFCTPGILVMAKALLDWETIDAEQIDDIVQGRPPRPPKPGGSPGSSAGGAGTSPSQPTPSSGSPSAEPAA